MKFCRASTWTRFEGGIKRLGQIGFLIGSLPSLQAILAYCCVLAKNSVPSREFGGERRRYRRLFRSLNAAVGSWDPWEVIAQNHFSRLCARSHTLATFSFCMFTRTRACMLSITKSKLQLVWKWPRFNDGLPFPLQTSTPSQLPPICACTVDSYVNYLMVFIALSTAVYKQSLGLWGLLVHESCSPDLLASTWKIFNKLTSSYLTTGLFLLLIQ